MKPEIKVKCLHNPIQSLATYVHVEDSVHIFLESSNIMSRSPTQTCPKLFRPADSLLRNFGRGANKILPSVSMLLSLVYVFAFVLICSFIQLSKESTEISNWYKQHCPSEINKD